MSVAQPLPIGFFLCFGNFRPWLCQDYLYNYAVCSNPALIMVNHCGEYHEDALVHRFHKLDGVQMKNHKAPA